MHSVERYIGEPTSGSCLIYTHIYLCNWGTYVGPVWLVLKSRALSLACSWGWLMTNIQSLKAMGLVLSPVLHLEYVEIQTLHCAQ